MNCIYVNCLNWDRTLISFHSFLPNPNCVNIVHHNVNISNKICLNQYQKPLITQVKLFRQDAFKMMMEKFLGWSLYHSQRRKGNSTKTPPQKIKPRYLISWYNDINSCWYCNMIKLQFLRNLHTFVSNSDGVQMLKETFENRRTASEIFASYRNRFA
jgi:hypothetical protein